MIYNREGGQCGKRKERRGSMYLLDPRVRERFMRKTPLSIDNGGTDGFFPIGSLGANKWIGGGGANGMSMKIRKLCT